MANVTITDLSAASALSGSELFETVQTGASVKTTATAIKTFTSSSPTISGGTLSGVAINSSTITNAVITGSTYASLTISSATINNALATGGTYASITLTNATLSSGSVPFDTITNFVSGQLFSLRDQTAVSATTGYAMSFDSSSSWNSGFSVQNSTNIIMAVAGTYQFGINLQWANTGAANSQPRVWLEKGGTDVTNSTFTMNVPKAADGGIALTQVIIQEIFTAGQTLVIYWDTTNTATRLDYTAASGVIPAVPSIVFNITRVK
jgi:hypothetical protein